MRVFLDDLGAAVAAVLPWLIAGTSLALALAVWFGGRAEREAAPSPDRTEGRRLELATAEAENQALREELDRLAERLRSVGSSGAPVVSPSAEASPATGPRERENGLAERLRGLADEYRAALSRAVTGDEVAADEAYRAAMELIRGGPAAFPAIRDAYFAETDPRVRAILVRALITSRGDEVEDFVASQLASEPNPEMRQELAVRASRLSTPSSAPLFRDAFLGILGSDGDAEAKTAAVRGLRSLRGDAEVDQALLTASSDAAEEVRLAAIEVLATRPDLRGTLADILEAEPDSRIRTIGNCRLVLAGGLEVAR